MSMLCAVVDVPVFLVRPGFMNVVPDGMKVVSKLVSKRVPLLRFTVVTNIVEPLDWHWMYKSQRLVSLCDPGIATLVPVTVFLHVMKTFPFTPSVSSQLMATLFGISDGCTEGYDPAIPQNIWVFAVFGVAVLHRAK